MRLSRFEDAVAIKHKINFYIQRGTKIKIIPSLKGFVVGVEYGNMPLKGNITIREIMDV